MHWLNTVEVLCTGNDSGNIQFSPMGTSNVTLNNWTNISNGDFYLSSRSNGPAGGTHTLTADNVRITNSIYSNPLITVDAMAADESSVVTVRNSTLTATGSSGVDGIDVTAPGNAMLDNRLYQH